MTNILQDECHEERTLGRAVLAQGLRRHLLDTLDVFQWERTDCLDIISYFQ